MNISMDEQPTGTSASVPRTEEEVIQAALEQEFGQRGAGFTVPPLPERIGPYKILRQVGAGDMGIVYEAQQESPIRRTVALKVIKLGMDTGPARIDRIVR